MTRAADFVIVGAGIQGASAAYHVARRQKGRVLVVEEDRPAGGATAASASMVMHQTGDPHLTDLALRSFEHYRRFATELEANIEFQTTGSILFASSEAGAKTLADIASDQQRVCIPTELLSAADIRDHTSGLVDNEEIVRGMFCPLDGYINPALAVDAYLAGARRFGAEIRLHVRATSITLSNNRVVAVNTDQDGEIATDCVINCAGNWARDVGAWAGVDLPLQSNRRNVLVLKPHRVLPRRFPIVEDHEHGWYVRHHPDGVLLGIGPTRWISDANRERTPPYDPCYHEQTEHYVRSCSPYLYPLDIVERRAGDRPMIHPDVRTPAGTPDDLPIVGAVPTVAGYFHSCGWGAFGITLGPIGGELIAQVVCGETPEVDLARYEWSRFADQLPLKVLSANV